MAREQMDAKTEAWWKKGIEDRRDRRIAACDLLYQGGILTDLGRRECMDAIHRAYGDELVDR